MWYYKLEYNALSYCGSGGATAEKYLAEKARGCRTSW